MKRRYSRLGKAEERKNMRRAFLFTFLTIAAILLFFFLGLPAVVKFAAFLSDIRKSDQPIAKQDITPPVLPRFDPLPEATNEFNVSLSGYTEPGVTVLLFLNSKSDEVLANSEGVFNYSFALLNGENTISAKAVDNAGNESQESEIYKIVYDNDPPALEILSPDDSSEYFGSKQRQVVIEGKTDDGAILNINDRLVVVDQDGTFTFATTLLEGENNFTIKSEDKAGNKIEKSLTLQFSP